MNRTRIWRTVQNSTWLLGGLAMLVIAFFLWIGMQIHDRITVEKDLKGKDVPVEPEKVQFSPTLGMMTEMVPELDINQDVSTSERTAEYRGTSFIKSQSGNWTVHVMSVSQEDIIKSYLDKRTDREKFFYMRSRKPEQGERYVLVYGSFSSVGKALDASKNMSFDLPQSVKAYPVRFSDFKSSVTDDVGSEDSITNLSKASQVYQVRLRSVPIPVEAPVAPPTPTAPIDANASVQPPVTGTPATVPPASSQPTGVNNGTNPAKPADSSASPAVPAENNPASSGPIADPFN
ncbi:hypothetical protein BKE30_11230 [Alkanindiges hydrocarboniclasticus]|uniref:SPOR domain-containing protein n=1 Tax=Alkanindiges hydrocarboniclasticus TaxID=1907941 RepID=A0A1S8CTK2_9GAMM|nr:hypothetical protein [Alkanindiges hydrocarboniclasticus]ONG38734.1 hypothetical protein BKE30_11230 [Alkanindiges hydrocarboniclasticus]